MEYYSTTRMNETMLFATTWVDLEIIILSEVSQRKTNTTWYHLSMESKKKKSHELIQKRNRSTDTEDKLMATKAEREKR